MVPWCHGGAGAFACGLLPSPILSRRKVFEASAHGYLKTYYCQSSRNPGAKTSHWVRIFKPAQWHPGPGCSNRWLGLFLQNHWRHWNRYAARQKPAIGFVFSNSPNGIWGQDARMAVGFVFTNSVFGPRSLTPRPSCMSPPKDWVRCVA